MLSEYQGGKEPTSLRSSRPLTRTTIPFVRRLEAAHISVTPVVVGARSYLKEYRSISDIIARFQPGVVHTHGYREDVIGGLAARAQSSSRAVSTVHGFTGGGRRNRLNERIQCFALRRADAVIAVSKPLVDVLARAGIPRRRIFLVPNGYAPPTSTMTRAAARQSLGIANDAMVVAWVGRLSREKGADVMLDALAQSDRSWQLSVIGDGQERERLREQAAKLAIGDRVSWHGGVSNAAAVFPAFDAFVLSSRTEGTPIVLFEAMHASIPIVATRVGGVPDVVTSEHALLVPPEEPHRIAESLAELKREPAAATLRSAQARDRVLHAFSAEAWIEAVEDVYRTLHA